MEFRTIDSRPAGMGDAVLGLWIAEGARITGERISFVEGQHSSVIRAFGHEIVSTPSQDCMALGYGTAVCYDEFGTAPADDTPRVFRWQRTLGWTYVPVRPTLSDLHDNAREWADTMKDDRPLVVIAPRASTEGRSMPLQKWLRLAWSLEQSGVKIVAIDERKEAVDRFPLYVYGFDWQHILGLLRRADVVAGNDSGIVHLGATLGVPTVVAMGPMNPNVVYGHCLDVVKFVQADDVPCLGCHFMAERGFNVACDYGCEALHRLPWTTVHDAIAAIIDRPLLTTGRNKM